jgi:autotransporter-associated beta strand protein
VVRLVTAGTKPAPNIQLEIIDVPDPFRLGRRKQVMVNRSSVRVTAIALLLAISLAVQFCSPQSAFAAVDYWQTSGTNASGSWSNSDWNTDSTGGSGGTLGTWNVTSGSDAVFSAGTAAMGAYSVSVTGDQYIRNITVDNGFVTLAGSASSLFLSSDGTWTTNPGTSLTVQTSVNAKANMEGHSLTIAGGGLTTLSGGINSSLGLTKTGSGTLILSADNTYSALTGGIQVQNGLLIAQNGGALGRGSSGSNTTVSAGATLELQDTGQLASVGLNLTGTGSFGQGALANAQGDNTLTGIITLNGDTTINVIADSLTLSNYLVGGFNLTKAGAGTLAFTASNAVGFVGSITVQAGVLDVANAGALGLPTAGGVVSVNSGATMSVHSGIALPAIPLTLAGNGIGNIGSLLNVSDNNSYAGTITLASSQTGIDAASGQLTLSGSLTGNGGIALGGDGAILFTSSASNYSGPLSVTSGTLSVPLLNNMLVSGPLGVNTGAVTLGSNGAATLEYTGTASTTTNRPLSVANGGTGIVQIDNSVANITLSGSISGGGSFIKAGPGSLTLSASNSFTGSTVVAGGTLALNTTSSLNGTSSISVLQGATLAVTNSGTAQLPTFATIDLSGGNFAFTGNGSISTATSAGALIVDSGQNTVTANRTGSTTYLPAIRFAGSAPTAAIGTTLVYSANQAQIQFSSSASLTNGILGGAIFYGTNDFATCTTTTGSYTILPYAGYTTSNLGTLASDSTLNVKPSGTQSTITNLRAINSLALTGSEGVTMSGSGLLTLASGGLLANTTGSISGGTLTGSPAGALVVYTPQNFSIGSVIADNGNSTALVKSGSGTLTLTGQNSFTGDIYINQGALQLTPSGNLEFDQPFHGPGNFIKAGSATLTLGGASDFTGSTTLSGGTLVVNGSLDPASTLYVQPGTVLSGTGTIGGNVVATGGAIAFSTTAGNIAGTVSISSGTLSVGQAGVGNYLTTTGGVVITGAGVLASSPSTSATIIGNVTYASSLSGNFSGSLAGSNSYLFVNASNNAVLTLGNSSAGSFGGVIVDSGILKLANSSALGGNAMTVNGGSLDLNGLYVSLPGVSGTGGVISSSHTGSSTLNLYSLSGNSLEYSGNIANGNGVVAVHYSGSGTQTLAGTNTFSGGLSISSGSLLIDGAGAILAGSSLAIGAGTSGGALIASPESQGNPTAAPSLAPVPEPGSLTLLFAGVFALCVVAIRKRMGA